jgi:hypothetical protein
VVDPHEEESAAQAPGTAAEAPSAPAAGPAGSKGKKKGKKEKKKGGAPAAAPTAAAAAAPAAAGEPARKPGEPVLPPKQHARPALGGDLKGDVFLETAATSIDKLRENWQLIAAALLVIVVVVALVGVRMESVKARNRDAWEAMRTLEKRAGAPAEDYLQAAERFRGTTAEPFLLLRAADAEFKAGGKEGWGKAIETYQRVADGWAKNPIASKLAQEGIDAARAAAAFDPAKLAAKGPALETAKDLPPLPAPGPTPAPTPPPGGQAAAPAPAGPAAPR